MANPPETLIPWECLRFRHEYPHGDRSHGEACPACREWQSSLKPVEEWFRKEPPYPSSRELWERIEARLAKEPSPLSSPISSLRGWRFFLVSSAALAAAIALGIIQQDRSLPLGASEQQEIVYNLDILQHLEELELLAGEES